MTPKNAKENTTFTLKLIIRICNVLPFLTYFRTVPFLQLKTRIEIQCNYFQDIEKVYDGKKNTISLNLSTPSSFFPLSMNLQRVLKGHVVHLMLLLLILSLIWKSFFFPILAYHLLRCPAKPPLF